MNRIRDLGLQATQALWFVPALVTAAHLALAVAMLALDAHLDGRSEPWEPFGLEGGLGIDASSARTMAGTIATALITAAGITFSGVLVALSLASGQYTSRVLRTFTANRWTQATLGSILGGFAYSMVALGAIGLNDREEPPELTVLGCVPLCLLGVTGLVLFVHRISRSMQASEILAEIAAETERSVERRFPERGAAPVETTGGAVDGVAPSLDDADWTTVGASGSGYVRTVDSDALVSAADSAGAVVRMEVRVGDFVVEGAPLASYATTGPVGDSALRVLTRTIRRAHAIGSFRTVEQDPGFGLRQMVDIALRALSPGVNDTSTAVMAIHRITSVLCLVLRRSPVPTRRSTKSGLRLIVRTHDARSLVRLGYQQIASEAVGRSDATLALVRSWLTIARTAGAADVGRELLESAEALSRSRPSNPAPLTRWRDVDEEVERLRAQLDPTPRMDGE